MCRTGFGVRLCRSADRTGPDLGAGGSSHVGNEAKPALSSVSDLSSIFPLGVFHECQHLLRRPADPRIRVLANVLERDAQWGELLSEIIFFVFVLEEIADAQPFAELLVDPQSRFAFALWFDHRLAQESSIADHGMSGS